jgi:hypothetical protein
VDLTSPATFTLGELVIDVPGLAQSRNKRFYFFKEEGLLLKVRQAKRRGSSRGKFKIRRVGDIRGKVDLGGEVFIRFQNDQVDGRCSVTLNRNGKYTMGRVRGTLSEANLVLQRAKATLRGGGRDELILVTGLATTGVAPAEAREFEVEFGDYFSETIPAEDFRRDGNSFRYTGALGGLTRVVVDYRKERILMRGAGLDLGEIEKGVHPVTITVRLGDEEWSATVQMRRGKLLFRY